MSTQKFRRGLYVTVVLCVGFIECMLYGTAIFGWASLMFIFKKDGVLSQLCDENITMYGYNTEEGPIARDIEINFNISVEESRVDYFNSTLVTLPGNMETVTLATRGGRHFVFPTCTEQDSMLTLAYTLGLLSRYMLAFPSGLLFDRFGLRFAKTLAALLGACALFMIGFAKVGASSWLVLLALPTAGLAGMLLLIINFHVCRLMGNNTSTVISLFSTANMLSMDTFFIVKLLHDQGFQRGHMLVFLGCLLLTGLLNTWLLLPKYKVMNPAEKKTLVGIDLKEGKLLETDKDNTEDPDVDQAKLDQGKKMNIYKPKNLEDGAAALLVKEHMKSETVSGDGMKKGVLNQMDSGWHNATFMDCVRSLEMLMHLFWFMVLGLRVVVFIGTFNPAIAILVNNDEQKIAHFTNVMGYAHLIGILAFVAGILTDKQRKSVAGRTGFGRSAAALPAIMLTEILSVAASISALIPRTSAIYALFFLIVGLSSFLTSTAHAYIEITFPPKHFGKLFGLTYGAVGAASFLIYPIKLWADRQKSYFQINLIFLILSLMTLIHPFLIWWRHARHSGVSQKTQMLDEALMEPGGKSEKQKA